MAKYGPTIGIVPDLHLPASRKHALKFIKHTFKDWGVSEVVIIGDLVDWSAISFHIANPDAPGPNDEYELAHREVQKWNEAFPEAKVCIGNHDARPKRKGESVNIPPKLFRDYADLWETPGWEWRWSHKIDGVYYHHGHGQGGMHPAYNMAKKKAMSCVIGHNHTRAGVKWLANEDQRWFGMDVGCLIDDSKYAFVYAKEHIERSVLGCGIIYHDVPHFIPMPVGEDEKYHDSKRVR